MTHPAPRQTAGIRLGFNHDANFLFCFASSKDDAARLRPSAVGINKKATPFRGRLEAPFRRLPHLKALASACRAVQKDHKRSGGAREGGEQEKHPFDKQRRGRQPSG